MAQNTKVFLVETQFEINHIKTLPYGYGHREITCELKFSDKLKLHKKTFKSFTNDMQGYDDACDLEGSEKESALFQLMRIEDDVLNWLLEIDNSNEI